MSFVAAVVLGIIQGVTEFLPISSDGHLALGELILGTAALQGSEGLFYIVLLHVATLLAVLLHFRRELVGMLDAFKPGPDGAVARRVVGLIVVASIPTAAIAFTIKDWCEAAYEVPLLVGLGFLGTSAVLFSTTWLLRRPAALARGAEPANLADASRWYEDLAAVRWRDALLIGAAQGLAPWPGLSRSGSTIAAALWTGVPPVTAARFSLLVSLPAIGGAFLLKAKDLTEVPPGVPAMAAGFVIAGVVGYLAIGWLITIVRKARLGWFALYTLILGLLVIGLSLAGGGGS
jgi:undecaprenyl-diphosphatase